MTRVTVTDITSDGAGEDERVQLHQIGDNNVRPDVVTCRRTLAFDDILLVVVTHPCRPYLGYLDRDWLASYLAFVARKS